MVVVIPEDATFDTLKARACAKLGISGCSALLLGSSTGCNQPEAEARTAPKLEDIDEVSPEDTLIVVPINSETSDDTVKGIANDNIKTTDNVDVEEEEEEGEDGDDEEEDEDDKDDGYDEDEEDEDDEDEDDDEDYDYDEDEEDEDEDEDDEDDEDYVDEDEKKSIRRRGLNAGGLSVKRQRSTPTPSVEAILAEEAVAPSVAAATTASANEESEEMRCVKERICKMLARGLHPTTPEHEATSAMKLANRLLERHQLSKADVLASGDGKVPETLQGGSSRVHMRSTKDKKPTKLKTWMAEVCNAVKSTFEVSAYKEVWPGRRCDYIFYGVAANASLAAFAFAAAFNRCAVLAAEHVVPDGEYAEAKRNERTSVGSAGAYTLAARESYTKGLASGLSKAAREHKKEERRAAAAKMEAVRAKAAAGEAWQSSDSDGHVSDAGDMDDDPGVPAQPAAQLADAGSSTSVMAVDVLAKLEREKAVRTALVVHTKKVAEDFLEEHSIKLKTCKKTFKQREYRHESFVEGEKDGKHINISQRSITER